MQKNKIYVMICGWLPAIFLSACAPSSPMVGKPVSLTVVESGTPLAARYERKAWSPDLAGGLSDADPDNVLYADAFIGEGDFRVEARLVIDSFDQTAPAFVFRAF